MSENCYCRTHTLTPLGLAAAIGNDPVAVFLLKRGAKPTIPASPMLNVTHIAAKHGHVSRLVLFSKQGIGWKQKLISYSTQVPKRYADSQFLPFHLSVDINIVDHDGRTP